MKILYVAALCVTFLLMEHAVADESSSSSSSEEECSSDESTAEKSSSEEEECSTDQSTTDGTSTDEECSTDVSTGGSGDGTPSGVENYSKCNPHVIAKIYELWDKLYGGHPPNVVETELDYGKSIIVETSKGFFSNVSCLYATFSSANYYTLVSLDAEGSCSSENYPFYPCDEKLISYKDDKIIHRYPVFLENGVTFGHTCVDCGADPEVDDITDGFMMVSADYYSCNQEEVLESMEKARGYAKDCGIHFTDFYPINCECDDESCVS